MADGDNFLAGPAPEPTRAVRQPVAAAPYKAPVSDGSNQGPQIGPRTPIARPAAPQIAASPKPGRQNNDRTSGMASAMGAMADKMHPVKRR